MNAVQLKVRASRLMNRLASLGFTKNGAPMVIDQAYELVAAEDGFRNQHILRTKLVADVTKDSVYEQLTGALSQTLAALNSSEPMTADAKRQLIEATTGALTLATQERQRMSQELRIPRNLTESFAKAIMLTTSLDDSDWAYASDSWELVIEAACKLAGRNLPEPQSLTASLHAWDKLCKAANLTAPAKVALMEEFLATYEMMDELLAYASVETETESVLEPSQPQKLADDVLRKIANSAYEDYDFGDDLTVCATNGWGGYTGSNRLSRVVFLQDFSRPDADTIRCVFTVSVENGQAICSHTF